MQSCKKATTRTWGWSMTNRVTLSSTLPLTLIGLAILVKPGLAAEPTAAQPDDVAVFMQAKLNHANDVLAGLALADFDRIRRGSQKLALASQASSWQVLQSEEYARQSVAFRRACERLEQAAREKNLDAAALTWMEVTMKCVHCHRYLRDDVNRR